MNYLIKHLINTNLDEIVSKSYFNCHTKNLHSIMLLDNNKCGIRLFIALPGNLLYRNFYGTSRGKKLTLSIHPHRRDLVLEVVKGRLTNYDFKEVNDKTNSGVTFITRKYEYTSAIVENKCSFRLVDGKSILKLVNKKDLMTGYQHYLNSTDLHTVAVNKNETVAWLVYEGKEDKNYDNICYNHLNPNDQISKDLYIKPSREEVINLLNNVFNLNI